MRRLAVFLIVLRLVADMATPLMPGAFRFNPGESIEVVRPPAGRLAALQPDRAPTVPGPGLHSRDTDVEATGVAEPGVTNRPTPRLVLPRARIGPDATTLEDH
jgi:hypothetical protein